MSLQLPTPTTLLITNGATTEATGEADEEFARLVRLAEAAAAAGVALFQIREKRMRPRVLYELAARVARTVRGTRTRLLVNDRADVARAAGADGVHLTASSLEARIVRRAFGPDFLIGASAHSPEEAQAARDGGADYALLGPVFDTPSKRPYGPALGLEKFAEAADDLAPFPVIAVGGVTLGNAREVFRTGARGVAAIRLFDDAEGLKAKMRALEEVCRLETRRKIL